MTLIVIGKHKIFTLFPQLAILQKVSRMENKMTVSDNYFNTLYGHTIWKTIYIFLCCVTIVIFTPLYYGVVWYERFGQDYKRTLINQLSAFFCSIIIVYILFVMTGDVLIVIYDGPFPEWYCNVQVFVKYVTFISLVVDIDFLLTVKFVYIFILKNPSIVHDDFWNIFIQIWTIMFSILSQFVYFFFPGQKSLNFFICIRNFSTMDNEVQRKTPLPVVLMLGFSIMFCLLINAKILHYKKKGPINITESQKLGKIKQFEKGMLINKILFLSVLMPLVVALIILLNITQKIHLTGKEFPHDVIYWILHSLPPILIVNAIRIYKCGCIYD